MRGRGEGGFYQPFISVVSVGLREEDDGWDGDKAPGLPAALHLLEQPGDGGHGDVAHRGVRAGGPAVLPESGLEGETSDLGLSLRVGCRLAGTSALGGGRSWGRLPHRGDLE